MKKKYCVGCLDNFYNSGGNECWSFETAKLVWRIPVGNWERPPYNGKKKVRVPNCYHEKGSNKTHYIDPKVLTKDGYWRY